MRSRTIEVRRWTEVEADMAQAQPNVPNLDPRHLVSKTVAAAILLDLQKGIGQYSMTHTPCRRRRAMRDVTKQRFPQYANSTLQAATGIRQSLVAVLKTFPPISSDHRFSRHVMFEALLR